MTEIIKYLCDGCSTQILPNQAMHLLQRVQQPDMTPQGEPHHLCPKCVQRVMVR